MAELLTAVKHNIKITHLLLNNGQLGKISKQQRAGDWEVWHTSLHNPDFSKHAGICGALGIRVTDSLQLDGALDAAAVHHGPALIEIVTDPELI
ncbi:MAG: thiamine pyrophosphate-dependent enzyme [Solirubrobacteraceae bacterium]